MKFRPAFLFLLFALAPSSAFAYVDPGSGMLIWQGLIALVGALVLFVRHPIERLKQLIKRLRGR